jgi:hypothetical protein
MDQKVSTLQHLWLAKLLAFYYKIEYRRGKENIIANAPSRVYSRKVYTLIVSTVSSNVMEEIQKS